MLSTWFFQLCILVDSALPVKNGLHSPEKSVRREIQNSNWNLRGLAEHEEERGNGENVHMIQWKFKDFFLRKGTANTLIFIDAL